ncbi:hypothetical protein [Insolitispirillum peregrinum]|uniref:Uncharacterized protein n=1 Tax=Insolitispirillum peregrinum TaxID=80876 RepID=A0A1N7MEY4_9PROT|nr:hypothetical protein [Insolitispirillum peregrinum]SIS84618.1 hypothetical protein SAMN05421779_10479 [Insolitispirillum peregrinum]
MSIFVLHRVVIQSRIGAVYLSSTSTGVGRETLKQGFLYVSSGVMSLIGNLSGQAIRCPVKCESKGLFFQKSTPGLSTLIFPQKKEIQPLRASLPMGGRP